jgi:hypothetical protein
MDRFISVVEQSISEECTTSIKLDLESALFGCGALFIMVERSISEECTTSVKLDLESTLI